jgi:hypothetical protein
MSTTHRYLNLLMIFIPLFLLTCMAACIGLAFIGIRRLKILFNL